MAKAILRDGYPITMDYRALGKVKSSRHRSKILELLSESPKTPKELARQTGLHLSNLSNYLTDLRKLGLVACLTNDLRKGRIYTLTEKGKEICQYLNFLT